MPRKRTGELYRSSGRWFARVTVHTDGAAHRKRVDLNTEVVAVARARLARVLAGDAEATSDETFEQAARRTQPYWVDANGKPIATAYERLSRLERYAFPVIGAWKILRVKAPQVSEVLRAAAVGGLGRSAVKHLLDDMAAVFVALWREDAIAEAAIPTRKVLIPPEAKADGRPRVVLTDDEIERFLAWPELPLWLRAMCLASRTLGGMRTSDLHRWDWTQVDREGWAWAEVPRPKTKSATRLVIPDVLVPVLYDWWLASGGPVRGPVFPSRRGLAKGRRQGKRSHARELRRALWEAGVRRGETRETDPLQTDTDETRRVDFHSFRRAYCGGLAIAGVNNQLAMALAGHRSPQTHQRYIRLVQALEAPAAALPAVSATGWPKRPGSK